MKQNSEIITGIAGALVPFTLIFGIYIVLSGGDRVGGAFQGGAVLSMAFMHRWLINPTRDIRSNLLQITEKLLMLGVLLLTMGFIGRSMDMGERLGALWMMLLNIAIGIKVCAGLSIIFFRFMFYEGGQV